MGSKNIILRNAYLRKIEPFIDKNIIKIITGQRRVGKSYTLLQLIELIQKKNPKANIIFIDKEKYDFDNILNYIDLIDFIQKNQSEKEKNYLFIDEIQEIEQFEKALRHYYDLSNFDIYCTGSNASLLSGELATFLSGRYIELKVYSLSYTEFLEFHQFENSNESLKKYLNYGGLPFIKNLPDNEEIIHDYLRNIYTTIIYKDIIGRFGVRNTFFLENLVKYLALNTSNLISAKKISEYLKSQNQNMSVQVILNYLSHLQDAFLIFKVQRADIIGKKIFELNEKYYFEDWGIRNALIGFKQQLINQIIENVIFLHLKICGFVIYVGKLGDKEIDFVAERNGETVYIQAAYIISDETVIEREFGNMLKINDNWRKIVVSMDEYTLKNFKGIEHHKLIDFLTDFK
jgi:predicted AAA+ superfamily ATPase